jgi:hypothetical protein
MIGSAITALVFVGLLITGVYITNVDRSEVEQLQDQTPSVSKSFFADLESVIEAREKAQGAEDEPSASAPNRTAKTYLELLRQKQEQAAVKPSSVFSGGAGVVPPTPIINQPSNSTNKAEEKQYLPSIPSITQPESPAEDTELPEDDDLWLFPDDDSSDMDAGGGGEDLGI